MSRWGQSVTRTSGEARRFWAAAPLETLYGMMEPEWAWRAWLRVAAGVISEPGTVFEPGCGIGLLADLLPEGCTYYDCDINPGYVEAARRARARPGATFDVRDFDDVLTSGEAFDWIVVTSLFGMFPETTAYELIPRFWGAARRGFSLTTVDKGAFSGHRLLPFEFTSHDPDRLLEAATGLPGVDRAELHRGREFPEFRRDHRRHGLALFAWRKPGG